MSNPVLVRISERDDQSKADTTDTVLAVRIVCFLPTLEQVLSDMRLLNTGSSELREFFEKDTPPYAILSHRWGEQEILYQDMIPSANRSTTQNKYGYAKLRDSCNLAQRQGYRWIWIDTCCIDKSSSAELTEAINSMYQWYEAAEVCYAYLNDARTVDDLTESKWFTRGWTLQELIAPDKVEFYSRSWQFLGTKRSLARSIAAKSGVDVQVLMGGDPLEMSVARRMYWASNRVTTRLEDEAYCLLGLFGVNMPLIYGEGRKAFRRLQEEIIRLSDDPSILAWYATNESDGTPVDFLASRPSDFLESGDIAAYPYRRTRTEAMMITSQGLSLEIVLLSFRRDETATTEDGQLFGEATAILDCQIGSIPGTFPTIILRRQSSRGRCGGRKHYYRIVSSGFKSLFSTERTQFESCDTRALRDETKLVIGLDPTQLDQNVYKESLGKCKRRLLSKLAIKQFRKWVGRFETDSADGQFQISHPTTYPGGTSKSSSAALVGLPSGNDLLLTLSLINLAGLHGRYFSLRPPRRTRDPSGSSCMLNHTIAGLNLVSLMSIHQHDSTSLRGSCIQIPYHGNTTTSTASRSSMALLNCQLSPYVR